jgi:hypothetical protein
MGLRSRTVLAVGLIAIGGCRNVSRFSSGSGHYEGTVVGGSFVRSNVALDARLCLTLDAEHLQDAPGRISSTDGRFKVGTAMRPVPQVWHDPLSTLTFGEGRVKNMLYMAEADEGGDVTVIVSLMESGDIEARLVRGAPPVDGGIATNVFGVFALTHVEGPCEP